MGCEWVECKLVRVGWIMLFWLLKVTHFVRLEALNMLPIDAPKFEYYFTAFFPLNIVNINSIKSPIIDQKIVSINRE